MICIVRPGIGSKSGAIVVARSSFVIAVKGILVGRDARNYGFRACVACQSKTEDAGIECCGAQEKKAAVRSPSITLDALASGMIALCHFDR
jgi:hypothetical protein